MTSVALSGWPARNSARTRSASAGLPSLASRAASSADELGALGISGTRRSKPRSGLGLLALLFESQDGELLGGRASLALSLAGHRSAQAPGRAGPAARRSARACNDHGRARLLAGGEGLLKFGDGLVQFVGRSSRLVDLAAQEVKRRLPARAEHSRRRLARNSAATIGSASSG